ncbi:hypothetical protein CXP35_01865 [Komagataeibacter xylinus]|nr:hypothetical protein CXP35_01865 [Komagataeibacter xylinus]
MAIIRKFLVKLFSKSFRKGRLWEKGRPPETCMLQSSRTEGRTNTSSQSTRHDMVPRNTP